MPKFAVIHSYEYTKTVFVEAADEDEASRIANAPGGPPFIESDEHRLTDEFIQEEE